MDKAFRHTALFARWLRGDLSDADRLAVERHPDFPVFRRLIGSKEPKTLSETEIQELLGRIPKEKKAITNSKRHPLWWVFGAAACVAVGLLIWALFFPATGGTPAQVTATTIGEQKLVTLPDGSTARLNAVSSLEILPGWASKRRLRLYGEAFFDVKNGAAPFIVETAAGSVQVLGTKFNVRYHCNTLEVACYTGLVQATSQNDVKQGLRAGQQAIARGGFWTPVTALTEPWPSWLQGESRFSDAPVYTVFAELERQYNITVRASESNGRRFSGTFIHHDLPYALRMVCEPLGLQYTIEGRQVLIQKKVVD